MRWVRIPLVLFRLTWPYLLTPWRSPLLRWRMETYGLLDARGRLLHAAEITPRQFFRFLRLNGYPLARMLRWAACL